MTFSTNEFFKLSYEIIKEVHFVFSYDKSAVVPNSDVIRRLGTPKFPWTFLIFGNNFSSVFWILNIVNKVGIFLFVVKTD